MQTEPSKQKRKSAPANGRVGILDTETGEVIDDGSLICVPKKVRIKGFFMGMQDGFEYLAKEKLNAEALNVLLILISRMDYENVIRVSQKEIGDLLSMKKQNVSRAMKALREAGAIEPGDFHAVQLCPDIGWKGKVQNLRKQQAKVLGKTKNQIGPNLEDIQAVELGLELQSKT